MNISKLVDDLWQVHRKAKPQNIEQLYDDGYGALVEVCRYIANANIEANE
jgi:hypothetical protein